MQSVARNTAFVSTIAPHLAALRARARRLCSDPADADDLLQDALERALRSGCAPDHARGWLFAILNRLSIDRVRRDRRAPPRAELDADAMSAPSVAPDRPELAGDVLAAAVAALPPALGATWRLRVDERLDYAAIADRLAIPAGTVATRLRRARALVRARLLATIAASVGA